jgi:hypothetical protein
MNFRVYRPGDEADDDYTGRANFEMSDGGVVTVFPFDDESPSRVIYGPGAWTTLEVDPVDRLWT